MMRTGADEVLDRSATPGAGVLHYLELAPPSDLADRVEGIALVWPEWPPPRRMWRLIPDARARARLPLTTGESPTIGPAAVAPLDARALGTRPCVVVRFTPWSEGRLQTRRIDNGPWWPGAARRWVSDVLPACAARIPATGAGRSPVPRPAGSARSGATETTVRSAALPLPEDMALAAPACYRLACDWLRQSLPTPPSDGRAADAWRILASTCGRCTIRELAERTGTSPRALLRAFHRDCACAPVVAQQIERLRRALRLLRGDLEKTWTRAALEAGFCDQSHFNRVFQQRTGMPPGRFFAEGHHHGNDIFARQVDIRWRDLTVRAVATPTLRPASLRKTPARHHRRT